MKTKFLPNLLLLSLFCVALNSCTADEILSYTQSDVSSTSDSTVSTTTDGTTTDSFYCGTWNRANNYKT